MSGARRRRTRHEDEPKTGANPLLFRPNDVPQLPAKPISPHRPADPFRGHKANPKQSLVFPGKHPQNKEAPSLRGSFRPDPAEFHRKRQSLRFRERKACGRWTGLHNASITRPGRSWSRPAFVPGAKGGAMGGSTASRPTMVRASTAGRQAVSICFGTAKGFPWIEPGKPFVIRRTPD